MVDLNFLNFSLYNVAQVERPGYSQQLRAASLPCLGKAISKRIYRVAMLCLANSQCAHMVVPANIPLLETALLRHRGFMELEVVCHELTHEMELKEDKATCGKNPWMLSANTKTAIFFFRT